ncbi:hypothetical protein [Streptacidiphilus griseoplanus]|uniref:hypothetical protein n=1 Tax=Peterkaempfera griseoplana TaxID=66896 RepID=UPI001FE1D53F|nr:hypothetical protein [Peterkaempfera griseoplana]
MSAEPAHHGEHEALFPMPPLTEGALRVAVATIDLAEAVRFEREFHGAWQEAVQTDSTVPMHTFLHRWGVFVALRRYPARAARLRQLEEAVARSTDRAEVQRASVAISTLLAEASREVAA